MIDEIEEIARHAFNLVRAWAEADPWRASLFAMASLILVWAIWLTITMWMWQKRHKKGMKMGRRARLAWLKSHKADVVLRAFDEEIKAGRITPAEYSLIVRQLSTELRLPDLKTQKKWNLVEARKPTKNEVTKEHLKSVKEGIDFRLGNWKVFSKLFRKVNIPGPQPSQEVKANVFKKKGRFFTDFDTTRV